MGVVLTTTAGLCVWIVLWSGDVKPFDAFMLTMLMMVVAATLRILRPYLPGNRRQEGPPA